MHLHINPNHPAPVYRQIQQQIADAIADRQIHPGEVLLPHEQLAAQLTVSPAAVRKAYEELESAGLCHGTSSGELRITNPELGSVYGSGSDLALSLLKKELLMRELETARSFQRRLLPPAEMCGNGWRLSSRCYPAGALAGDFYDVLELEDDVVDLVIADVADKGLAAGLIMATAKSMLPHAAKQDSAGDALGVLNQRLCPLLNSREFVALAYARFDPANGSLQFANAGLPDPYLLRHTGRIEPLPVTGDRLPLGIRQDARYVTSQVSLEAADRLLMLTDGLPEATDQRGDPIGYEGLVHLMRQSPDRTCDAATGSSGLWLDRLLGEVSRLTGSILQDDWTAVLLEYQQP
jgi:sigma-B regulation protein RsbU (phosphoserine phosphatase)